jgi:arsenate reductase-like glutaredoxin family protein
MPLRIYGIKNCDTMKKAFAWLDSRKLAYEFHDYKKDGVPPGKLADWSKHVGLGKAGELDSPADRRGRRTARGRVRCG